MSLSTERWPPRGATTNRADRPERPNRVSLWPVIFAAVAAALLTLLPAMLLGPRGALFGGGVVVAVAVVALALRRFTVFLVLCLLIRPLLDQVKSSNQTSLFELTSVLSLLFLAAAALWLIAQREAGVRAPSSGIWLVLLAMVLFSLLSTLTSLHLMASVTEFIKLVSWFLMFLVVRRLAQTEESLRTILAAVAAAAVIPLLCAYYELITPGVGRFWEVRHGLLRLTSTFDLGNSFGRFLMLFVITGFALAGAWCIPPTRWSRLVTRLALLALPVPLYFTYTRAAFIGVGVGVLVVLILQDRRVTALLLVGVALLAFAFPASRTAIQNGARPEQTEYTNDSVAWRFDYWQQVLELTNGHELLGIGPGSTTLETLEGKEPHNEYLRALVENGVLGLLCFLGLLLTIFLGAVRVARDRLLTPLRRACGAAGAGTIAAIAAAGVASNIFDSIAFMWYVAVLVGVVDASIIRFASRPAGYDQANLPGEVRMG